MPTYNGHKNWNHWNVAIWIANDEGLYRTALRAIRVSRTKDDAARLLMQDLRESNTTHTLDGAPYTFSAVRAALVGLE